MGKEYEYSKSKWNGNGTSFSIFQHICIAEFAKTDPNGETVLGTECYTSILRNQQAQSCQTVFSLIIEVIKLLKKNNSHLRRVYLKSDNADKYTPSCQT